MTTYTNHLPEHLRGKKDKVTWQVPSNIALVKYWGKFPGQMPCNPSLSMTLNASVTKTTLEWEVLDHPQEEISLSFSFMGEKQELFFQRLHQYLKSMTELFPFLYQLKLKVSSENSFPYGAGIASSASAYASIALCLVSIEQELLETVSQADFFKKASYCARLGSGSGCRSLYPHYVAWGNNSLIYDASNSFAAPVEEIHTVFKEMCDTILIVSATPKKVSSSLGHEMMKNNPFATKRYFQAKENFDMLVTALSSGDWEKFATTVEEEAFSLHAMMMTSRPGFLLIRPNTLSVIEKVKAFREETHLPITFTLDAGPNVHLIYPKKIKSDVMSFIQKELLDLLDSRRFIDDEIGAGPVRLE